MKLWASRKNENAKKKVARLKKQGREVPAQLLNKVTADDCDEEIQVSFTNTLFSNALQIYSIAGPPQSRETG